MNDKLKKILTFLIICAAVPAVAVAGMYVSGKRSYYWIAILTAALLAGAAVSIAGMIGYIGLIVPNLIKNRMGTGCRARLTACLLFGAALLLLADLLARQLAYPWELPVGMLLSLLGVPFFIFLLAKRKRGRR